ncbi:hypothetical protein Clacol_000359 [Clathrus columnatus]|uniref:Hydrophobin n=1 Tax=Clathrus columnatus TaxID=1419009 RepID=A0AAV4ZZJ6_9AGAM|nr:hypothetical protein Clacol_000359 [Clathrus columnatus]
MFTKLTLVLTALAVLAIAIPTPDTTVSQCNTGSSKCCNNVGDAQSADFAGLLGLLSLGDITGMIGTGCTDLVASTNCPFAVRATTSTVLSMSAAAPLPSKYIIHPISRLNMSRWTQYDELKSLCYEDEYRLPEGMTRVGYDADTQRYTFQRGNELWLGEPGVQYGGNLTRTGVVNVFKFVNSDDSASNPHKFHCPDGETAPQYHVKAGDSCWTIANSHKFALETLLNQTLNPKLDCDHLKPGEVICLPLQTNSDSLNS